MMRILVALALVVAAILLMAGCDDGDSPPPASSELVDVTSQPPEIGPADAAQRTGLLRAVVLVEPALASDGDRTIRHGLTVCEELRSGGETIALSSASGIEELDQRQAAEFVAAAREHLCDPGT